MCSTFTISVLPTRIDKTILLVLCFRCPAPVWRLVFPILFFFIAFFFGLMHGLGVVFGGGVDGVEDLGLALSVRVVLLIDKRGKIVRKKLTSGVGPVLTN